MSNNQAQQALDVLRARNRKADGALKPRTAQAVAEAISQAPRLAALAADIVPRLPYKVLASTDIKSRRAWSVVEPVCYAVTRQYLGLSNEQFVNAIVVDCDHDDSERWRACGLPPPTWIAITPESGRHHVVWWLETPVFRGTGARMEPLRFLARVVEAVTYEMGGDVGYAGALTKNPWHSRWHVIVPGGQPVTLGQMLAAVACAPGHVGRKHDTRVGIGRNIELFDRLRFWAYEHRARYVDRRAWSLAVAGQAAAINQAFPVPLKPYEVGSTVKSVANWVWSRYRVGSTKMRVTMDLDEAMPLADKQAAAGVWAAEKRRSATDKAIDDAVATLRAQGKPVTQAALAEASGKSLRTIKRRWATITVMLAEPVPAPQPVRLVALPGGRSDGAAVRTTMKSRAEAWRRFQFAAITAQVRAEQKASTRPPVPAFLVAAARVRAAG